MAVTARDILFIMRAQDFASREVDRVARSFGRVGTSIAELRGKVDETRLASKAQVAAYNAAAQDHIRVTRTQSDTMIRQNQLLNSNRRRRIAEARERIALDKDISSKKRAAMQETMVRERTRIAQTQNLIDKERAMRDKQIHHIKEVERQQIQSAKRAADARIMQEERALQAMINRRNSAQRALKAGGGMLATGAVLGVGGALGLAGLGAAALEFSELDTALRYVSTQMPEVNASLSELQSIVDNISTSIPVARDEITEAMYDIASSVDLSADRFKALKELEGLTTIFSAAAVAGQTDVRTVTRLGVQLANAYQTGFGAVGKIMADTFQLVRFGIGEYEEFADVLGRATPVARGFGQEMESVFGSFIFLTRFGLKASEAASAIPRLLQQVFRGESRENIKALGVDIMDVNGNVRQFHDILSDVFNSEEFKALSKEGRMDFFTTLTGREGRLRSQNFYNNIQSSIEVLDDFIERINDPNVDSDAMIEAFETMYGSTETSIQLMKNSWQALVDAIGSDVIGTFTNLIRTVTGVINWLRALDPDTRKTIIQFIGIASAAALVSGVFIALSGVFVMLAASMSLAFGVGAAGATLLTGGLLIGIPLLIAAITGLIWKWEEFTDWFRGLGKRIVEYLRNVSAGFQEYLVKPIFKGIGAINRGIGALAGGFAKGLNAIIRMVADAGMAVYKLLQRLNPFARFSPSLVDNVRAGVDAIVSKYGELKGIIPAVDSARAAVDRLRMATGELADAQQAREQAEINELLGIAGAKAVAAYAAAERAIENLRQEQEKIIPIYRRETEELDRLENALDKVQFEYDAQKQAVEALERSQDALNYELQLQERTLDRIGDSLDEAKTNFNAAQNAVDDITRSIQDAERAMQDFAQAPLTGQGEFEDKMFALEQQALAVRKEMTKWKAAGAPPEAMDFFNLQLDEIQNKMDKLQIERDIEIEPLRRELEKLADTNQELTFEEAREGILNSQKEIDKLEKALPGATKELEKQQKIVDKLQDSFDAQEKIVEKYRDQLEELKDTMEDENRVLELIAERLEDSQKAYDAQESIVRDLETAYNDLSSEIGKLESSMETIVGYARDQQQALEEAEKAAGGFKEALAELDKGPLGEDLVPVGIEDLDLSGIEEVTSSINNMTEAIKEAWLTAKDRLTSLRDLKWAPNAIGQFMMYKTAAETAGTAVGKTVANIVIDLRTMIEKWRQARQDSGFEIDKMITKIGEIAPELATLVRIIIAIINGDWATAWSEASRLVSTSMDNITGKITEKNPSVLEAARKLANNVVSGVSGLPLRLATKAGTAVQDFIKGVEKKFADVKEVALRLVRRFLQAFNEMNPTSLGKNFVQGLIDGLDSKIDELDKKAKEAADTVTRRVHDGWMIGSPSRLAQYYGQMFGAGLGLGISDMEREVVNEAMSITRAAANALDPSQVNGTGTGFPSPVGQNRGAGSTRQVNVTIESGAFSVNIDGNADESVTTEIENKLQEFLDDLSDELRTGSKGTL